MKRLCETTEWESPFFQSLASAHKLAWLYINAHCDCAGVIYPQAALWSAVVGENIDAKEFLDVLGNRVYPIENGAWHITGFIRAQYGNELKAGSTVHKGVIRRLNEGGLSLDESLTQRLGIKPFVSLTPRLKDQDKDQNLSKDEDKSKDYDLDQANTEAQLASEDQAGYQ